MISFLRRIIGERNPLRLLWHKGKSFAAALYFHFPARRITVIGISGTDGKTTTVGMIAHILRQAGRGVGAASTAFLQINDSVEENATHLTSISPWTLQKFLRRLIKNKCEFAIIEMSSHGLVQGRVDYTFPQVAGITNTALEHLDYHGSMEQYRRDKGIMFEKLRGAGVKVLNGNDDSFEMYNAIPSEGSIVYGPKNSGLSLSNIQATDTTCTATLHVEGHSDQITLGIPGTFNLENAMCAIGCALSVGIPLSECLDALKTFKALPGRMERIDEGQDFSVFVDFAVSPQSYEKSLEALQKVVDGKGRVMVLCSSCGNRMEEKRPIIGNICSKMADVVVVTEDETYGEDPHKVLEEVWAGVDQSKTDAHKIFDRREAIEFLFKNAKTGDAIVLCGMGPFSTFTKLEGRIPWDERDVAREVLRSL
jgi:UDP-N-acetylmuramoyl-L-alanyl-D-glutamate--2,6-diaminopimelate ligase